MSNGSVNFIMRKEGHSTGEKASTFPNRTSHLYQQKDAGPEWTSYCPTRCLPCGGKGVLREIEGTNRKEERDSKLKTETRGGRTP